MRSKTCVYCKMSQMYNRGGGNEGSKKQRTTYLHIHVRIHRHEQALILLAPLKLNMNRLANKADQKWLGGHKRLFMREETGRESKVMRRVSAMKNTYASAKC